MMIGTVVSVVHGCRYLDREVSVVEVLFPGYWRTTFFIMGANGAWAGSF